MASDMRLYLCDECVPTYKAMLANVTHLVGDDAVPKRHDAGDGNGPLGNIDCAYSVVDWPATMGRYDPGSVIRSFDPPGFNPPG